MLTLGPLRDAGCWHLLWVQLLRLPLAFARVSSVATNSSEPSSEGPYVLETRQFSLQPAPLVSLGHHWSYLQPSSLNVTGTLVHVGVEDADQLSDDYIAYVSCDQSAYHGPLDAGNVIEAIVSDASPAKALLLYSTESRRCDLSADGSISSYSNIFSVDDPTAARDIRDKLNSSASADVQTSSIVMEGAIGTPNEFADLNTPNDDSSEGFGGQRDSSSPSSSVAMIILYSVTGVIAALFLGVIITGAIRAHRHPERYGPRNIVGRPRQSRARGLARAMLETLPIVKFGDLDEVGQESQKPDVEMASHDGEHEEEATRTAQNDETAPSQRGGEARGAPLLSARPATASSSGGGDGEAEGEASRHPNVADGQRETEVQGHIGPARSPRPGTPSGQDPAGTHSTLGCPICADNFVKGQDVRLLPCKHKFHPECVDPWLVNVSGTCPLCRIDLHPPSTEEASRPGTGDGELQGEGETATTTTAEPGAAAPAAPRSRRLSEYIQDTISAMPLRDSSLEQRLDLVRRLRGPRSPETTATSAGAAERTEDQGRQSRLTERLRDRVRARGR